MVGKTNVAGARLRSVIAVTYPAGSMCTCTNGTRTLKARDTSGYALFNVTVGEWTVSCTDGERTKSVTVSITAEGQVENVTISYAVYFLRNGELNPSLGNIVLKSGTTTFSDGVISGTYPNNSTSAFTFDNPITVSFDILKFRALLTSQHEVGAGIGVGLREINTLPDGFYGDNYVFKAITRVNSLINDYEEFSLDVSALRGQSLYIVGNAIATWKIDMIWAE